MKALRVGIAALGALVAAFALLVLAALAFVVLAPNGIGDRFPDNLETSRYAITTQGTPLSDFAPTYVRPSYSVSFHVDVYSDGELFIGIANRQDVDAYLRDVPHDALTYYSRSESWSTYRVSTTSSLTRTPDPPDEQDFWVARAFINRPLSRYPGWRLDWPVEDSDQASEQWVLVIMNADAQPGLDVDFISYAHFGLVNRFRNPASHEVGLLFLGVSLVGLLLFAASLGLTPPTAPRKNPDADPPE